MPKLRLKQAELLLLQAGSQEAAPTPRSVPVALLPHDVWRDKQYSQPT